jgi:nitroreductase
MDTYDCIKQRRSIRKFKSDKISHDVIEKLIEFASFAPSWKNTQITRYIAIEDESIKNKIANDMVPPYNKTAIETASVLFAVSFVKNRCGFERDGSYSTAKGASWQMFDAGLASQTLCLAAADMGIGSVIEGIFDIDKISELLNIPDTQELVCLIPMGYPDEEPTMPKRKSVEDLLTYFPK